MATATRYIPMLVKAAGTAYSAYKASQGTTPIQSAEDKSAEAHRRAVEMWRQRQMRGRKGGFEAALINRGMAQTAPRLGVATLLGGASPGGAP